MRVVPQAMTSWARISIEVGKDRVDEITGLFESAGALSVTCQDAADQPLLEPAPGETPLWSNTRITALFEPDVDTTHLRRIIQQAIGVPDPVFSIESLDDCDWSSTWRDSFTSMRFGSRLWVCPSGEDIPADPAVVIHLDPGLAFGTGTHATTAMCLEWLDGNMPAGRTVIDYGCGSGILAIAACKLGAARVYAVDIDPQALQSTRDNAGRNGITAGLAVQLPDEFSPGSVDLVIANILANPLIELAGKLTGYLAPGGSIAMTGILAEQAEDVMSAYRAAIDFAPPLVREEWVLLTGRKR